MVYLQLWMRLLVEQSATYLPGWKPALPGVMVHDVAANALGVSLEPLAPSGITNRYAKTASQCFG